MPQANTKHARRILALLITLAMALAAFSGCGKQGAAQGDPDVFTVGKWMADPANAMQFQYIAIYAGPDADEYFAADEDTQRWILATLADAAFISAQAAADFRPDFAFAMNEPYLFFGFNESMLTAKVPSADGMGYVYYAFFSPPEALRARIDEQRQAHGAAAQPGENQLVGGYSAERDVTPEDLELFNQAMEGLVGVVYEPTKVATQVVAGMNYRFTATATPVVPNPEPYTVHITIFKPLEGAPELSGIERIQ